jgi:hypothetical protein
MPGAEDETINKLEDAINHFQKVILQVLNPDQ